MLNLKDQEYGRLTVIKEVEGKYIGKVWKRQWLCFCDPRLKGCGNYIIVIQGDLRTGNTKSCGCLFKQVISKVNTKHGLSKHYLYRTWVNIKSRCYDETDLAFKWYGRKGIDLYKEWWYDLEAFIKYINANLGPRPEGCTLDRIDNRFGYIPGNLKWSTAIEQANNRG